MRTFGTLRKVASRTQLGQVEVSYNYRRGNEQKQQVQRTTLADLRGQNILGLVQDVPRLCHETGEPVDGIDLSAMGQDAALVNDSKRIRAAMKMGSLPFMNP